MQERVMKICFINPRSNFTTNRELENFWNASVITNSFRNSLSGMGLSLLILASLTPDDIEVSLIDENIDQIDFDKACDIIALTATTQQASRAYQISAEFRKRGVRVVLGGIHATVMTEEAANHVDHVITGEGESVWNSFLSDFIKGNARKIYKGEMLEDINKSPIPKYDLLNANNNKIVWIQTTRGCPRDCDFCVASKIFGCKYRVKSIERIIEEITTVKNIFNRPQVNFADDNMFCNRKRSKRLLEKLVGLGIRYLAQTDISVGKDIELLKLLKKSGCAILFIGFESIDPTVLKKVDKSGWKYKQYLKYEEYINNIQSVGIGVFGAFIVGFDTDTHDTFSNLINFIDRNHLYAVQVTILTPYPGSRIREDMEREARLLDVGWNSYTCNEVTYIPRNFTPAELHDEHLRLYRNIYSRDRQAKTAEYFKKIYSRQIRNMQISGET